MRNAIIIALWALAAGAITWAGLEVFRLLDQRRRQPREAETEPVGRLDAIAAWGVLLLVVCRKLRRRPRAPQFVGATEEWSPKAETDGKANDPGLITRKDRLGDSMRTHDDLATLRAAEAEFDAVLTATLARFVEKLPADAQLALAAASAWVAEPQTGEFARADLDALLAQDRLVTV